MEQDFGGEPIGLEDFVRLIFRRLQVACVLGAVFLHYWYVYRGWRKKLTAKTLSVKMNMFSVPAYCVGIAFSFSRSLAFSGLWAVPIAAWSKMIRPPGVFTFFSDTLGR